MKRSVFLAAMLGVWLTVSVGGPFASSNGAHAYDFAAGALAIGHPYVRATPPNAPVAGGYMTIDNAGDAADRLIGATADFAGRVEIHEMSMMDDVMVMRPLDDGLEIPAGGQVELKPGGYHLMFMDLKETLAEGELRPVTLSFEKAGDVSVTFAVETIGAAGHGGHADMENKTE